MSRSLGGAQPCFYLALGSRRIFGVDHYPLLTVVHPTLAEPRRSQSANARHGTLRWQYSTIGITTGLPNMPGMQGLAINPLAFYLTAVVSLVTGTMFLMKANRSLNEVSAPFQLRYCRGLRQPLLIPSSKRQGDLHSCCQGFALARYDFLLYP